MRTSLRKRFYHYFIPHESNNFRAKSLHHHFFIFYIIIIFFIQTSTVYLKKIPADILGYATDVTVEKILFLVNQERGKRDLSPVILSSQLTIAATNKAHDMFSANYWAHVSPTGATPWEFINKAGYRYVYAGENLAKSFATSEEIVTAWMNSPTHRANILKPEYQEIGLAIMNGKLLGEETTLVVQQFGTKTVSSPSLPDKIEIADNKDYTSLAERETVGGTKISSPVKIEKISKIDSPKTRVFTIPKISKTVSLVITEFLLIVLFIDSLFIWKHKTVRINGYTIAHIIFLISILGAMGASGIGVIL